MRKSSILAIIPSYNEEDSLPSTLGELRDIRPDIDIVVVDDGSSDNTAQVARDMGVNVIRLPANLGVGGAVQTGYHYALRHGYDVAFQYDADGQHRADQVEHLVAPVLSGEYDVVLGSRFLKDTGYKAPIARSSMMWLLRTLISAAIGQRVTDTTSGFRAYNRSAIRFMTMNCSCDFPDIDAIVRVVRSGFRFREIAVPMRERVAGKSMFTPWRATYYMIRSLMGILISVWCTPRRCRNARMEGGIR